MKLRIGSALCALLLVALAHTALALSWDDYAALLGGRVDDRGLVDYAAIKKSPGRLEATAHSLETLDRADYESWDRDAQIAFWINAYNALTIELIVDHYPIHPSLLKRLVYPANSIRQIDGAWDKITFPVMGEPVTLNHIEHEVLRKRFKEPRIHAALVCAALSCPPLRRAPFRADSLDAQLDDQVRRFLARPDGLSIDREHGVVRLSAIFDWFAADFVEQYGVDGSRFDAPTRAVLAFVGRYVSDADRRYLETGDFDVEYFDYDWTLNERTQ